MISKEDYINYLDELQSIEVKMQDIYKGLMDRIDDPALKETLGKLLSDEVRHENILETLTELFDI